MVEPNNVRPIPKRAAPVFDIVAVPIFQTRAEAEGWVRQNFPAVDVAAVVPPFDQNKRVKSWIDPRFVGVEDDGVPVTYRMLVLHPKTQRYVTGPDGAPIVAVVSMSKADAATANIPPKQAANEYAPTSVAAQLPEVQYPLRELEPVERLEMRGGPFGGVWVVRTDIADPNEEAVWTKRDRQMLEEVWRKIVGA